MRIQIHNEHWKWIIWLFILILLNAIALAGGRGERRDKDRSSSDSAKQPEQTQQSPQPAPQQSPAREARPVSQPVAQPVAQPRRTEAPVSVSQSDSPRREVRSRPQSDSTNQAVSSQSQPRTVQSSRPVRHEVIVAPSSQSMDVSSPRTVTQSVSSDTTQRAVQPGRNRTVEVGQVQSGQSGNSVSTTARPVRREVIVAPSSQSLDVSSPKTVTQSVSSGTTDRAVRSGRDRTVEVSKVQSEQSSNSVSTTVTQPRRDRTAQTVQIASNDSKATPQQGTRSDDSSRQPRDKSERTNISQSKANQNNTTTSSSITTTDTTKSQETASAVTTGAKPDRTQVSNRSDNSRNSRASTVVRHEAKRSPDTKVEPVVAKTDQTDTRAQRNSPSQSDGQRADNRDRVIHPQPQDASRTPSIIARTDNSERVRGNSDSGSSGRGSDSRWSKLRSKITERADSDMRSRDGQSDREGRLGRDENRGRVVVNNNNIHIERGGRDDHSRPFVSRHLIHDIRPIRDDNRWEHHGSYFSFHWSNRSCGRVIMAPYHNYYGVSYYYPSYHRKYLFVSLGGYWPYSYRYQRYYWYGCHPYYWYGSYVVPQPDTVVYDYTTTNNYYSTPDYYSTSAVNTVAQVEATTVLPDDSSATDAPLPQTQADICFAEAVNAFEQGRYDNSVELFRQAVLMSPDDEILPFTYTQSLFASGDYALAAYVLREVMAKMPAEEPAVYFPRGLYKDDQILINQIASLESAIAIEPFSTDYQLLLGYQCMGIGQWDKAVNALEQAARNPLNAGVVNKLLDIAEKMENDAGQTIITAPQI